MIEDERWIIKWNSSALAILCNKCRVIIKTGKDFNREELSAVSSGNSMPPYLCEKCFHNQQDEPGTIKNIL